ncbi:RimK family protein [Engelhardtia mirabilis]|uniref:Alpha-aminoadipate--LysW ligase LysX n=1 Tax=Engelhardtia mirabilis TaxID=2528011 RepID=A0A518BMF1_9BACT|nr:Alpha-aminoadipate--LysW ligase LysX [Planctomycetes bacterium Pla133]QDV02480.1 Alpha-aminoadipate--LysW ligase LysX [Planctomycetes bacterium Pla86]
MRTIVVVSRPSDWPLEIPGVEVVRARDYLTDPAWVAERGVRMFNLTRSYRYQSEGYYVSLLAAARRHRPFPDLMTILDMKSRSLVRNVDDELDDLIQKSLQDIRSERFELSVYFGNNLAKRHQRLARSLFARFPAPLFRAVFQGGERWHLTSLAPIALREVPKSHWEALQEAAVEHFARRRYRTRSRKESRYDLAILHDPEEELAPSDPKALERFRTAAESVGFGVEMITRDDFGRLGEFDALFIRETTAINHHTFRFAHRAEAEGLVVIDDPQSILRCTNKVYQTEALALAGVAVPKTWITDRVDADEVAERIGFPCVLKLPDSAFSQGVVKCADAAELEEVGARILGQTELLLVQEFTPSEFDWRVGVFAGEVLYVCRYLMARGHWQIVKKNDSGGFRYGRTEPVDPAEAPAAVLKAALRAAVTIGDGLYGVDLKQFGRRVVVIEVNDNPNIDAGCEDALLKQELYRRIMAGMLARVEQKKGVGR